MQKRDHALHDWLQLPVCSDKCPTLLKMIWNMHSKKSPNHTSKLAEDHKPIWIVSSRAWLTNKLWTEKGVLSTSPLQKCQDSKSWTGWLLVNWFDLQIKVFWKWPVRSKHSFAKVSILEMHTVWNAYMHDQEALLSSWLGSQPTSWLGNSLFEMFPN